MKPLQCKVKQSKIYTYRSSLCTLPCHYGNSRQPYGITQCYLPSGRGDISAFTAAKTGTRSSDPRGMQGWVGLGTAVKVCSPCPILHITVARMLSEICWHMIKTYYWYRILPESEITISKHWRQTYIGQYSWSNNTFSHTTWSLEFLKYNQFNHTHC